MSCHQSRHSSRDDSYLGSPRKTALYTSKQQSRINDDDDRKTKITTNLILNALQAERRIRTNFEMIFLHPSSQIKCEREMKATTNPYHHLSYSMHM